MRQIGKAWTAKRPKPEWVNAIGMSAAQCSNFTLITNECQGWHATVLKDGVFVSCTKCKTERSAQLICERIFRQTTNGC